MDIVLLGAGMMSSEILWMVQYCLNDKKLRALNDIAMKANEEVDNIRFFDQYKNGKKHLGHTLLQSLDELRRLKKHTQFCYAAGNPKIKENLLSCLEKAGFSAHLKTINISAANYNVSSDVEIGPGCFIGFSNHISPRVTLKNYVTVNYGCFIAHDCEIGDFTNISSRVTINGNVKIGERCHIGSGSIILNNVNIGNEVLVTVGSVITTNIPDGMRVVGNPARYFKWEKK